MSDLVGRSFVILQRDPIWFPAAFHVIAETEDRLRLQNDADTYWVRRDKFEEAEQRGVFREVAIKV